MAQRPILTKPKIENSQGTAKALGGHRLFLELCPDYWPVLAHLAMLTIGLASRLCPKNEQIKRKANTGAAGGDRTHDLGFGG